MTDWRATFLHALLKKSMTPRDDFDEAYAKLLSAISKEGATYITLKYEKGKSYAEIAKTSCRFI